MTCIEGWTSCNGFILLILALLAIAFNLTPLIADYVEDGRLLYSPISCYEWWLPGLVGGGLLFSEGDIHHFEFTPYEGMCKRFRQVLPAVAMSLAARRKGSCNSRCGMLTSSLLSLVGIIGAAYCSILSIFAIGQGPLICETGSNDISKCDYTLANLSSFGELRFDLAWFLNTTCLQTHDPGNATALGIAQERFYDLKLNEDTQKIIHITVFVALAIIGLLEGVVGISQTAAGLFGFICGTSKRNRDDYDD